MYRLSIHKFCLIFVNNMSVTMSIGSAFCPTEGPQKCRVQTLMSLMYSFPAEVRLFTSERYTWTCTIKLPMDCWQVHISRSQTIFSCELYVLWGNERPFISTTYTIDPWKLAQMGQTPLIRYVFFSHHLPKATAVETISLSL